MKKYQILLFLLFLIFLDLSCSRHKSESKSNRAANNIEKIKETTLKNTLEFEKNRENFQVEIFSSYEGLLSDDIKDLKLDKDALWVCCGNGITYIDKTTGKIINFAYTNNTNINFSSIILDDGFIYLSSDYGVYGFNKENKDFFAIVTNVKVVPNLIKYKGGFIYGNNEGKFYIYEENSLRNITSISERILLIKEFDNEIFILSEKNIYKINPKMCEYIKVLSYSNINVKDFCIVNNNIYLANSNLIHYSPEKITFTKTLKFSRDVYITFLLYSKEKGGLYIGTSNGLGFYNEDTKEYHFLLTQHKVKEAYINCIEEDNNVLWVGTKEFGLIKYKMFPSKLVYK